MHLSQASPTRSLQALLAAAAATFGLLLFMASLTVFDSSGLSTDYWTPVDVVQPKVKITDEFNNYTKLKAIKPKRTPVPDLSISSDTPKSFTPIKFNSKSFTESDMKSDVYNLPAVTGAGVGGNGDRMASLTVSTAPRYPSIAAERNLEGYVDVIFDIAPNGTTTNLRVLTAEPKNIFNRNAIKAVKTWRYKPEMVDGIAVTTNNVVARVIFVMDDQ